VAVALDLDTAVDGPENLDGVLVLVLVFHFTSRFTWDVGNLRYGQSSRNPAECPLTRICTRNMTKDSRS